MFAVVNRMFKIEEISLSKPPSRQTILLVLLVFIQNWSKSTIWSEENKNMCWLNSSAKGKMKYRDWLTNSNVRVRLVSALFWRSLLAANWWENQPVTWLDANKALPSMKENHDKVSHGQVLLNTKWATVLLMLLSKV